MNRGIKTTLMTLVLSMTTVMSVQATTIVYTCATTETSQKFCDYLDARWKTETKGVHSSRRIDIPWESDKQLSQIQQAAAVKSSAVDIYLVDVVWPGFLADHLLNLNPYGGQKEISTHVAGYAANNTVHGEVKAMPSFMDTGMLFYRKDLLDKYKKPVPTTWIELKETAQFIMDSERKAGNKNMWGYVFQGKAYEGLTCNALEWIASYGGGNIIEQDGSISINNPKAAKALDTIASFVGSISPEGITGYTEEEARKTFQSGNAVFERNWPYVYGLANADDSPIKGKVAVAILPKGDTIGSHSVSTLGGWSYAVSVYTKHPKLAAQFLFMITDAQSQKERFMIESQNPTITSLYDDPALAHTQMYLPVFKNATARPSSATGPRYNEVSSEIWNAAYSVLSGQKTGIQAVAELEKNLEKIKKRSNNWKR